MSARKTLCLDFDGVIHSYGSGWKGATEIPDPPVDGAFPWIREALDRFDVCIYSSRSRYPGAIDAMRAWFAQHGMPAGEIERLQFSAEKPAAHLTIDDRAYCFEGQFPDLDLVEKFTPWNKREYPRGKARPDDQGQLAMKIESRGGIVRLVFNKPIAWIGMGATEARQMAAMLLEHAAAVEN